MSLIQLSPADVTEHWEQVKIALKKSLPPTVARNELTYTKALRGVLERRIQPWAIILPNENGASIRMFLLTGVEFDAVAGGKSLVIYAAYGVRPMTRELWADGLQSLGKYALANGCSRLLTYIQNRNVAKLALKIGARPLGLLVEYPIESEG